jgi:hypothetical protein
MEARQYAEHYNQADYRLWDGDWELIRGTPFAMVPPPGVTHQHVSARIARQLGEQHKKIAKVYQLHEGRYVKQGDYFGERSRFVIDNCHIDLDFRAIWRE